MSVFYVFQGETYSQEREGGYVWSPQLDGAGRRNAGYTMMTQIRKGDFILHNSNSRIVAISTALTDCYESDQPHELVVAQKSQEWNREGYRVDCNYHDIDVSLYPPTYTSWFAEHYEENSAFTRVGRGKQQYMCALAESHAVFLLEKLLSLRQSEPVRRMLQGALGDIVGERISEYDNIEMDEINSLAGEQTSVPQWRGVREAQAMTTSPSTGRQVPKRDPQRAADALAHASFRCEYDPDDRIFQRKNGKGYTEPHHLIPISRYRDFRYSVDVMENIVSLCSHCHNLLHYGRFEDKIAILMKLYVSRRDALRRCGLDLTLEQLLSYYR